jgi:hypothetical protein
MAKSAYYIYAAEDDHRFLGRISVEEKVANNVDRLMLTARKQFKVKSIRIESKPRAYRPPLGKLKIQPALARKGDW